MVEGPVQRSVRQHVTDTMPGTTWDDLQETLRREAFDGGADRDLLTDLVTALIDAVDQLAAEVDRLRASR